MNRNDCTGSIADSGAEIARIHAVIDRIDVDKDRSRAEARNHPGRCEEGEGGQDHLVSLTDAERHQGNEESVGARSHADRMNGVESSRRFAFEILDLSTEDESLGVADSINGLADLLPQQFVLSRQIEQRHGHNGFLQL